MRNANWVLVPMLLLLASLPALAQPQPPPPPRAAGPASVAPPPASAPAPTVSSRARPPIYDEQVLQRLEQTGLVVLPGDCQTNLHDCYYGLEMSGQPMYITADAMLYLWYEAHRQSLMAVEKQWLRPQLAAFTERLLTATQKLRAQQDDTLLRSNAVMLEVVWALLDPSHQPLAELADAVKTELTRVREHKLVELYPGEDYTQYEVRGYYTKDPLLSDYFRGAKYLARRYFRVADARYPADAERELRRALLLALAMRSDAGLTDLYRGMIDLRVFLCGPVDTIGLDQVLTAATAIWGEQWGRENLADLSALRRELMTDKYPTTRINTRVTDPDMAMMPARNIALLGEHYLPDSDLFHQTTEPRVPGRHLPSGLDVATALGSPLAAEKLRSQAAGFAEVEPNAKEFGQQMKLEGLYGSWLGTLRTLFDQPQGLPNFAKSPVYEAKQLNCCLTSWAQLRHNYILYGAQANTCLGAGDSPVGLVEPLPGFFAAYGKMCRELREKLQVCKIEGRSTRVLELMERKAATFERCASDQLTARDTSWAKGDIHGFAGFIRSVYFDSPLVIADVATNSQTREVLHAASGPFRKVLVRYPVKGEPVIAQGWVGSYYEFSEPAFGRVTDEEWQERLGRTYGKPEPPDWLAGLYQPEAGAATGQRQRLAQIEGLLAQDKYDEARQLAEALIKQEQDTEWAPRAVLMLGDYLLRHKRREEGVAMLERARPMYGCEARDQALARVRNYGESREAWEERNAERERRVAEQLAATAPREGLTEAQEIERQNRRAALLLGVGIVMRIEGSSPDDLRRLLAECPKSGYVPFAELSLVFSRFDSDNAESREEPAPAILRQVRADLLALADKYAKSIVGESARVMAAGVLSLLGENEAAYREALPLLEVEAPKAEPYPLSAKMLDDGAWQYSGPGGLCTSARSLCQELLNKLVGPACRRGDLDRIREYIAAYEKWRTSTDGNWQELPIFVTYLKNEPDGLRALLKLGLVQVPYAQRNEDEQKPDVAAMISQALPVVQQFPASRTAPAALFLIWRMARFDEQPNHEQQVPKLLSERYPNSLECLAVKLVQAGKRNDLAEVKRLGAKLAAIAPDACDFDEVKTYPQYVVSEAEFRAPEPPASPQEVAAWTKRYGKFITASGMKPADLPPLREEAILVQALAKRLPQHELEIVLLYSATEMRYGSWMLEVALERHPSDPLANEVRFRLGRLEDIAYLIAAGPKTPHFKEAVERFAAWKPGEQHTALDEELYPYRMFIGHYAETPLEPLACSVMAAIYLHHERPEQALKFVTEKLAAIPEGRLLRERLLAQQENAERQITLKRAAPNPPLWTVPLETGETPFHSETHVPGLALSADGSRAYACGLLEDGRPGVVAFDAQSGQRRWATACADLDSVQPVGEDLVYATRHGTVGRLDGNSGKSLWDTPVGLAQTGHVALAIEGDTAAVYWDQGVLVGLDLATGRPRWQRGENIDWARMSPGSNGDTPLALCRGVICGWDQAGHLRAWRASDGERLWSLSVAQVANCAPDKVSPGRSLLWPVACGGKIVAGVGNFQSHPFICVDPASGKILWRSNPPEQVWLLPTAMRQSGAVFVYGQQQTAEWSLADGKLRWTLPGGGDEQRLFAIAGDYAAAPTGDLLILDRRSGQVVARQSLTAGDSLRSIVASTTSKTVRVLLQTNDSVQAYGKALSDKTP